MPIKDELKRIAPKGAWNAVRDTYNWFMRLPELPGAYLHPWRRASMRRLEALRDIHRGRRAFILGNGPSLRKTDLSKLRGEFTFGLNRIYLAFPEMGFATTYFVSVNSLVIEQCADEIRALPIPKFLSWRSHKYIRPTDDTIFLYTPLFLGPRFAQDVRYKIWEGATVTNVALQLAFFMGFEEVILIGVDHSFKTSGPAHQTVISGGDDPDHFHPGYFGKGFRWQLPDLETSELAYGIARQAYEKAGRRVLDATIDGKLTVFPKADYNSLF